MALLITKAKPNPAGKDRYSRALTPATQLTGEWIDFQNIGANPINLDGTKLYHFAYLESGETDWVMVMGFTGVLQPNKTVRVHSGNELPLSQMRPEDQTGTDFHLFTGKDYIWNNNKKDYPALWRKPSGQWIDKTQYDAHPTEGKILKRVNGKLL